MNKKMNSGRRGHRKVPYLKLVKRDFTPIRKEDAKVSFVNEIKENKHVIKGFIVNWIDKLASKYLNGNCIKKIGIFIAIIALLFGATIFLAEMLHAKHVLHDSFYGDKKEKQIELQLEHLEELNKELAEHLEKQKHFISEIQSVASSKEEIIQKQNEILETQLTQIEELKNEIELLEQQIKQHK